MGWLPLVGLAFVSVELKAKVRLILLIKMGKADLISLIRVWFDLIERDLGLMIGSA